jgi:ketosteroid isomerase-like protein
VSEQNVSESNVEIVRRGNDAFNRGDLDALLALYAPEAELIDRANAPDQPSIVRGREMIRRTAAQWLEPFEEFRCDVDEYIDAGDAVICSARWHGRGKASGATIDLHQYDVYELIDGKVVRATMGCRTTEEALRAARIQDPDVR